MTAALAVAGPELSEPAPIRTLPDVGRIFAPHDLAVVAEISHTRYPRELIDAIPGRRADAA